MRNIATALVVAGLYVTSPLQGEAKKPEDASVERLLRRSYHKRINLAVDVPQYPEYYTWRVTGKIEGKTVYPDAVPFYYYDDGEFFRLGEIPIGTEVKLDTVRAIEGHHFYGYPLTEEQRAKAARQAFGWIDGRFIERDDAASWSPPKK